jgi:hypothetical protein
LREQDFNLCKGRQLLNGSLKTWKERLRWIKEQIELEPKTRDDAKMVEQLMSSIEQEDQQEDSESQTQP